MYQFVDSFDKPVNTNKITYFFQVASFEHPKKGMYNVKKFAIDQNNKFIDIKGYWITKGQFKKFLETVKSYQYKIYPVYDLDIVEIPRLGEIVQSRSEILTGNYDYTGFAPFDSPKNECQGGIIREKIYN